MNKEVYDNLSGIMNNSPDERRRFMSCVSLSRDDQDENDFSYLNLSADGRCSFLEQDSLCHIISKYSQEYLPDTCAFYPRVISEVDDVAEVSATTSCPELSRLLITDDQPMAMEPLDLALLPRQTGIPISRKLETDTSEQYEAMFSLVRPVLADLLGLQQYSLNYRMFLMSYFADQMSGSYFHGCTQLDATVVDSLVEELTDTDLLDQRSDEFVSTETDTSLLLSVVVSILKLRLDQGDSKLSQQIQKVFKGFPQHITDKGQSDIDLQEVMQIYHERTQLLSAEFQTQLDHYLTRYCINHLYREWYIGFPNLIGYVHLLSVRLAMIRFLVISHERCLYAIDNNSDPQTFLGDVVIETVYTFSRAIDQDVVFLRSVYDALETENLLDYDYALHLNCL